MKRILIAVLVAFVACTSQGTDDECTSDECLKQQAYNQVMAVHDEVMPKLGQISELKKQIEEKMKSSIDSATANEYVALMQELDEAEQGMWVWMRAFDRESKTLPLDSALSYLGSEQDKVDEVAEKINSSITAAEKALN